MILIPIWLLLSVATITVSKADKVKISVYYETNCPDSKDFILYQLYPTYKQLSDYMELELVPYGKATQRPLPDGTYAFDCQHGPNECKGNQIQTCAINLEENLDKIMDFINCSELAYQPHQVARKCAGVAGIDYQDIEDCSTSRQGNQFQHVMADKTHGLNPRLNFVPWININGEHSQRDQRNALNDLKGLICNKIQGDLPDACRR